MNTVCTVDSILSQHIFFLAGSHQGQEPVVDIVRTEFGPNDPPPEDTLLGLADSVEPLQDGPRYITALYLFRPHGLESCA